MPRVAGVDPGTGSLDLVVLDDGAVVLEKSFETAEPEGVMEALRAAGPLDLIAGPSGYGLPLVSLHEVGERELRLLLLAESGTRAPLHGLRALLAAMREAALPVVLLPGVIHLATVPPHRKVNRVDLGTADKVCVAAYAVTEQARTRGTSWTETSFVLVEMGGAFTAVLTVEEGRIVSGQGGSSGPLGYRAAGALDGEVAHLLSPLSKAGLFTGGVVSIAGDLSGVPADPDTLARSPADGARLARTAFVEGIVKAVAAERALLEVEAEVLLSGRLSRIAGFRDAVLGALDRFGPVRVLAPQARVKEAAYGAALLADGLAGGRYAPLVDGLGLREARGSVLDHLHMEGAEQAKAWATRAS